MRNNFKMKPLKAQTRLVLASLTDLYSKLKGIEQDDLMVDKQKSQIKLTGYEISSVSLINKISDALDLPKLNKGKSEYFPLYFDNVRYQCNIVEDEDKVVLTIKEAKD